ncbi:MAG: DUF2225 domain-containing protein [Roseburia sp.]|nr:DUF2225 domain-containing protein [Roseburia sp.]
MNLFEGLEKFGLQAQNVGSLFEEEKKTTTNADGSTGTVEEIPTEDAFLLEKGIRCAVCDKGFKAKMIKNGRVKRLEPDLDLRPRFQYIDTIKYDVTSCPNCGYTAMNRYFDHLSSVQLKLIKEQICANFKPSGEEEPAVFDYDYAIGRYKLALYTTMVKKGKTSEKAYTCLKIAWLFRGKAETLDSKDPANEAALKECKAQEEMFYQQAYEGFMKAVSSEMFPMCGMDQNTVDYLLAYMSAHFKRYDVASKCIANILQSPSAQNKTKERARDLKEKIIAEIKASK